ncbi:MAG: hypothetical protein D6808_04160 [Candidatus Dadabacteria bacterium]|nr:MAG: hypothetical protein D6808_04160 [Candidatus Dadabacteria bacterium]
MDERDTPPEKEIKEVGESYEDLLKETLQGEAERGHIGAPRLVVLEREPLNLLTPKRIFLIFAVCCVWLAAISWEISLASGVRFAQHKRSLSLLIEKAPASSRDRKVAEEIVSIALEAGRRRKDLLEAVMPSVDRLKSLLKTAQKGGFNIEGLKDPVVTERGEIVLIDIE